LKKAKHSRDLENRETVWAFLANSNSDLLKSGGHRADRADMRATKRLLAIGMTLGGCLSLSLAQGIQGNVKLSGKAIIVSTGHGITLTWKASQGAASYSIYRGTTEGGPYAKIAAGIQTTNYTDLQVTHKQTLYYVTTAVSGSQESGYSNETVAVVP